MTVKLLQPFLNMTIKPKATYSQMKDLAAANSGHFKDDTKRLLKYEQGKI